MTSYATRQLLRETIIDELQVLPELLRKAESRYYEAHHRALDKRERLTEAENDWLRNGTLSVHDETARRATLRTFTEPFHAELRSAETEAARWKAEVDYLLRKMENYRVMAKLLAESYDPTPQQTAGFGRSRAMY